MLAVSINLNQYKALLETRWRLILPQQVLEQEKNM